MENLLPIQTGPSTDPTRTPKLRINREVVRHLGAGAGKAQAKDPSDSCGFSCTCSEKCSYDFTCGCG